MWYLKVQFNLSIEYSTIRGGGRINGCRYSEKVNIMMANSLLNASIFALKQGDVLPAESRGKENHVGGLRREKKA